MTATWPALEPGEALVSPGEDDEMCFRNVHPLHVQDGVLTSQVFLPSEKDDGKRSTARSSVVDADKHFNDYRQLGNESVGVWEIPAATIQDLGLRWIDDSQSVNSPPPIAGHAVIDFRSSELTTEGARRKLSRKLGRSATKKYPSE